MAFRTQKISQMTPKGSDLEATDLIEVSTIESGSYVTRSITGQEIIDAAVGNVDWGDIGGTLSAQTDLQNALDAKVPTSRTLTINGTTQDLSADRTFTISTGITIGTTAIASGVVGRVLFEGTGNVVQESANLFWDNTNNRLGVGTSSPTNALTIGASVAASLQSSAAGIFTSNENASNVFSQAAASADPLHRPVFAGIRSRGTLLSPTAVQAGDAITTFLSSAFDGTAGQASAALSFDAESNASSGNAPQLISFITGTSGASRTTKMQVRSNGNVLIGTTTDAGFKLDVNGTARISGLVTASLANYNSTHTGNTTRGFYIVNSADSVIRAGIEYDGTNAFVQLAGRFGNGAAFFRQNGGNGDISFLRNGVEYGRIFGATGNWGINTTTDAGFRLDVNGTARFVGNTFVNTGNSTSVGLSIGDSTTATLLSYFSGGLYFKVLNTNAMVLTSGASGGLVVGASGSQNTASARLQVDSTTQGFLPPRMTTTQKNAIATPATGLMVYDTTLNLISVYNGTTWITL